ncbi:hypothetical protein QQP08_007285 [Theobroma cacao]|nr:hypothetical protein QQP08_007285 [Theobroma cacao]
MTLEPKASGAPTSLPPSCSPSLLADASSFQQFQGSQQQLSPTQGSSDGIISSAYWDEKLCIVRNFMWIFTSRIAGKRFCPFFPPLIFYIS